VRLWLSKIFILTSLWANSAWIYAQNDSIVSRILTFDGKRESLGAVGPLKTPLGSLYKIFSYAYLIEKNIPEIPYTCKGQDPEEIFCCKTAESINRDQALAKSCTPYFTFQRLGITQPAWRDFWNLKLQKPPIWLTNFSNFKPEQAIDVDELLQTLKSVRTQLSSFSRIDSALMGTVLFGTARNALKSFGSILRVKTFTWRDLETTTRTDKQGFTGGFAGWLADGSAIWASQAGHGRDTFQLELIPFIESHLAQHDSRCVRVKFFDRYSIKKLTPSMERPVGTMQIQFKNGQQLTVPADGTLRVSRSQLGIQVSAELSMNEYVARVLDREVRPDPLNAARAFAIAIRSYLYQNAKKINGCFEISDSSHTQRVSPKKASLESLKIARWTDNLTLDRVPQLRYHSTISSTNRMSWEQAKGLAQNGFNMLEILNDAYPTGMIKFGPLQTFACKAHPTLMSWIRHQSIKWKPQLLSQPGFEEPDSLKVCQSPEQIFGASVFASVESQEIYVPELRSSDDEVSILHEYLHIAFRNHPRGQDEFFIEKLARTLQEEK